MVWSKARDLTIRDVVRYYANVEGGVHFGKPKDEGSANLISMAPLLLGHATGQIEILAHIGQVVVNALTPLCDLILTSPTIDRRMHHLNESGFYDGHWTAGYFRDRAEEQNALSLNFGMETPACAEHDAQSAMDPYSYLR